MINGGINILDFLNLYAFAATLDMAFILIGRRSRGKPILQEANKSFIGRLYYTVYRIPQLLKDNGCKEFTKPFMPLFVMDSFPVACLYSFAFSVMALLTVPLSGKVLTVAAFQRVFLSEVIFFTIFVVLCCIFGESRIRYRDVISRNCDKKYCKVKDVRLNALQIEKKAQEVYARSNGLKEATDKVYSKFVRHPFHSFLQAVCLILIVVFYIFLMIVRLGAVDSSQIGPEFNNVWWDVIVYVSVVLPFVPFISYLCIVTHRRNIVSYFLLGRELKHPRKELQEIRKEKYIRRVFSSIFYTTIVTASIYFLAHLPFVRELPFYSRMLFKWWGVVSVFLAFFVEQLIYEVVLKRNVNRFRNADGPAPVVSDPETAFYSSIRVSVTIFLLLTVYFSTGGLYKDVPAIGLWLGLPMVVILPGVYFFFADIYIRHKLENRIVRHFFKDKDTNNDPTK